MNMLVFFNLIDKTYLSFIDSSFFMVLQNELFINQTFIFIISLIFFHVISKYQKTRVRHIDVSMYYCFILCKNALFYIYMLNILIAVITSLFFDPTPTLYVTDDPSNGKGMHIPQPVVDGFKNVTQIGANLVGPMGAGLFVSKVASGLPPQQKFYVAAGSVALYFAGDTIVKIAKKEQANPVSGVNKLFSFFSNPTPTPVSNEVNSAISSIDSLLTLTNAGFVIVYAMLLFILLILFNLLRDDILARLQFLWLFQKYPQVLKWVAKGSKWLQVACCIALLYACYLLYKTFSLDLFILNKIKNVLNNL